MQPNVYNFFKFLNQKEQRPIPFKVKLIYTPETLTPQELNVEGNLSLQNTPITSLPEGLKVEGSLYLHNTPLSNKTDEEIKAMIGPQGHIKGYIFR